MSLSLVAFQRGRHESVPEQLWRMRAGSTKDKKNTMHGGEGRYFLT